MACTQGSVHAKFVWNAVTLPTSKTQFAYDLNGDGVADNALGNALQTLAAFGPSPQANQNAAIAGGKGLTLTDVVSSDSTFTTDGCAQTTLLPADDKDAPDFSGSGTFTPTAGAASSLFPGALGASAFASPAVATATDPITVPLKVAFLASAVPMPLVGAHLVFTHVAAGLSQGQLNGAIRNSDVQTILMPLLAAGINAQYQANPSPQLKFVFDNGGTASPGCASTCANPDGTCAVKNDGKIDTCEVTTNSIVGPLFQPDVQLYQNGIFARNPLNTVKDAFSIGIGFTAVPASF